MAEAHQWSNPPLGRCALLRPVLASYSFARLCMAVILLHVVIFVLMVAYAASSLLLCSILLTLPEGSVAAMPSALFKPLVCAN